VKTSQNWKHHSFKQLTIIQLPNNPTNQPTPMIHNKIPRKSSAFSEYLQPFLSLNFKPKAPKQVDNIDLYESIFNPLKHFPILLPANIIHHELILNWISTLFCTFRIDNLFCLIFESRSSRAIFRPSDVSRVVPHQASHLSSFVQI
jgi:hypothetical protein